MKRSSKCLKGFFYIEGKLKLRCLTILWKSRWVGGSLNLEILRGGGLKQFWKSRWKGGSKNLAFRRGGGGFFWNNPFFKNVLSASCSSVIFMRMVTCIDLSYTTYKRKSLENSSYIYILNGDNSPQRTRAQS